MNKIIEQILKFGIVGGICFLIDFTITNVVAAILRNAVGMTTGSAALIGAFWGFVISVIINYLLSMKYVFERKEEMSRRKEFVIFTILSLFGLLINEAIIKVSIDIIYENILWIKNLLSPALVTAGAKIVATGIVMVYNFVTRKIFLEKKEA